MGQRAAVYCRVSTSDQSCDRQQLDLAAFAQRGHYDVVSVFEETASGNRADRIERAKGLCWHVTVRSRWCSSPN